MPKDIKEEVVDDAEQVDTNDADGADADPDLADLSDEDAIPDEDALLEEDDDVLEDDDDDLADDLVETLDEEETAVEPGIVIVPVTEAEETPAEEEEEEELDDDDVEASLDVILKERLVVNDDEDEDEDEPADAEDRGDGNLRVLPKQPGEFVCRSCFLVKSESQLADPARMLCRDCV